MSFLKKLFGGGDVPEWAPHMSGADYRQFQKDVEEVTRESGLPVQISWPTGQYFFVHKPEHSGGLMNLSQGYTLTPPGDRHQLIRQFFETVNTHNDPADLTDEQFRAQLRVRIYAVDYQDQGDHMVTYDVCEGFVTMLALDWPNTVSSAHPDELTKRNLGPEEAFDIGLRNVWTQESVEVSRVPTQSGAAVTILSGDSYYSSTHALHLDRYLTKGSEATFIVPHRHLCIFVEDADRNPSAIEGMRRDASKWFQEGPGSVSPLLFRWEAGKISVFG